ncbi:MAG: MBL fold metallo-hydrolase [Candidatus Dormiibacterota bacterium]
MRDITADLVQLQVVVDPIFDQNCYILRRRDTDRCLVVDPGLQVQETLRLLEQQGWGCDRILVTHGHPDHVAGVPAVRAAHRCSAAIHPDDRFLLEGAPRLRGTNGDVGTVECDEDLTGGQVIAWRELRISVLHTPGHTPGSVSFLVSPDLLSGDTLFRRSIGRTDLPGGSMEALLVSIQDRLYPLPAETVVHPGHGPETTIGEEMRSNPFVRHPRYR